MAGKLAKGGVGHALSGLSCQRHETQRRILEIAGQFDRLDVAGSTEVYLDYVEDRRGRSDLGAAGPVLGLGEGAASRFAVPG